MRDANETTWRCRRVVVLLAAGLAVMVPAGCRENARLAGVDIPHVEVGTVEDQGLTLGPDASPTDVAFVLLRAIHDDMAAGSDADAREAALARQRAVCDPDFMYARYRHDYGDRVVATRDQLVYLKVHMWAPVLGHYAGAFDFDVDQARSIMKQSPINKSADWAGETVYVEMPAADPDGDPKAAVNVVVWLHHHASGYWRVFQVGFSKKRPVVSRQPTPAPLPASAAGEPAGE